MRGGGGGNVNIQGKGHPLLDKSFWSTPLPGRGVDQKPLTWEDGGRQIPDIR